MVAGIVPSPDPLTVTVGSCWVPVKTTDVIVAELVDPPPEPPPPPMLLAVGLACAVLEVEVLLVADVVLEERLAELLSHAPTRAKPTSPGHRPLA